MFRICRNKAYPTLPPRWRGSCTLGIMQPGFFLFPREKGDNLGVPIYDHLRRDKRNIIQGSQKWADEVWPPERIRETHGSATWVLDGSWGYRTPIYMLNCIICHQAVMEILTNKTTQAIELISHQQWQSQAVVCQNRLALDYLLAEEGQRCGKFNTPDCCLKIDDTGEAVLEITQNIRRIALVPVQRCECIFKTSW